MRADTSLGNRVNCQSIAVALWAKFAERIRFVEALHLRWSLVKATKRLIGVSGLVVVSRWLCAFQIFVRLRWVGIFRSGCVLNRGHVRLVLFAGVALLALSRWLHG